jgi:hypothetical protein
MVLIKGNYFEDEVILNKEKAIELALWIQEEHDDVTTWVREIDKESEDEAALLKAVSLDPALEKDITHEHGGV